jgi:hypothetical protein
VRRTIDEPVSLIGVPLIALSEVLSPIENPAGLTCKTGADDDVGIPLGCLVFTLTHAAANRRD